MNTDTKAFYEFSGVCPICEAETTFSSINQDFRSNLICPSCTNISIPRERSLTLALKRLVPDWRDKKIHESSPVPRGFTLQLRRECKGYVATQYFPDAPNGEIIRGFRNENLECQTFPDESFDIVMSLDVLEHVNEPQQALKEIARTLVSGGYCIFTAPTYVGKMKSERRACIHADGTEEILVGAAEYHGNPVNAKGALVTFHYGYDLPELIFQWSGMSVEVHRFYDPFHGIIGPMTEVYVCRKEK
jgi:SAM-dependent methyltransferase